MRNLSAAIYIEGLWWVLGLDGRCGAAVSLVEALKTKDEDLVAGCGHGRDRDRVDSHIDSLVVVTPRRERTPRTTRLAL
ncbi:MAG: hypothetical protein HQK55_12235 [Deltaproteobacteria bacterium]|nr:hypothetical protein [Deltaproteobacteria bacterium]